MVSRSSATRVYTSHFAHAGTYNRSPVKTFLKGLGKNSILTLKDTCFDIKTSKNVNKINNGPPFKAQYEEKSPAPASTYDFPLGKL